MGIEKFSIHLAYSTMPVGKEKEFKQNKEKVFKDYLETTGKYFNRTEIEPFLYKPLTYHLFGTFDIVFISLIDNYKFCQKVFDMDSDSMGSPTNYQIVTGICNSKHHSEAKRVTDLFNGGVPHKFVHITNFKINNGLLIGNGNYLVDKVLQKIKDELGGAPFILFKSFNWSEIILIQFGDNDIVKLQKNIVKFREYSLGDLEDTEDIVEESLYHFFKSKDVSSFSQDDQNQSITDCHIFADTHSYTGVDYELFNAKHDQSKKHPFDNIPFKSVIEMQVKPGHLNELYYELSQLDVFEPHVLRFKNGKTDYVVKEKSFSFFHSNYMINQVYRNEDNNIKKHIRRIKTNFLIDVCKDNNLIDEVRKDDFLNYSTSFGIVNFSKVLETCFSFNLNNLKESIKKIGVSRQLREKVLKAFSNFNNLIKDTILYGEFIELHGYLKYFEKDINGILENRDNPKPQNPTLKMRKIERKWTTFLQIYEDAYHNRVHNNYLYEDINEFSIDFNSAVNQINSIHDFIVKKANNAFFPHSKNQIIVTQNEIDSKSNAVNVNYNVYHYLEPSLIFTTLMKEVLNSVTHKAPKIVKKNKSNSIEPLFSKTFFTDINEKVRGMLSKDEYQFNLVRNFDFTYFFTDLAKMAFTFLFDYSLYEYWAWTYFLQDSSLYEKKGQPDEELFQKELLRISLIKFLFEDDSNVLNPVDETEDLWEKHHQDIAIATVAITNTLPFKEAVGDFISYLFSTPFKDMDLSHGEPNSGDDTSLRFYLWKKLYVPGTPKKEHIEEEFKTKKYEKLNKIVAYTGRTNIPHDDNIIVLYLLSQYIKAEMKAGKCLNDNLTNLKSLFDTEDGYFMYICAISHACLTLFRNDNEHPLLLQRTDDGKPSEEFLKKETPNIFSDSTGGFFYSNRDLQKKHFGYINEIIDNLWHLSEVEKKRLFFVNNSN